MSRTRWLLAAIGMVLVARWCAAEDLATPAGDPDAYGLYTGIEREGFLVMESRDRRVVREIGRDNKERRRRAVPAMNHVRLVGTAAGPAIAFIDKKKLVLGQLGTNGELTERQTFGRAAKELCASAASSDKRFAVGWREATGTVWFVHGGMSGKVGALADQAAAVQQLPSATAADWCTVVSADDDIAVLWTERARLFAAFCTQKRCSKQVQIPLGPSDIPFAIGCLRDGCLISYRGGEKLETSIAWVTTSGKLTWSKQLPVRSVREVSITAAGPDALVVSYLGHLGATVSRVQRSGSVERVWADPTLDYAPDVAWSRGSLLLAWRSGAGVHHEVVPLLP
jgi:hypothetical protein